jgi:hypothetical protein
LIPAEGASEHLASRLHFAFRPAGTREVRERHHRRIPLLEASALRVAASSPGDGLHLYAHLSTFQWEQPVATCLRAARAVDRRRSERRRRQGAGIRAPQQHGTSLASARKTRAGPVLQTAVGTGRGPLVNTVATIGDRRRRRAQGQEDASLREYHHCASWSAIGAVVRVDADHVVIGSQRGLGGHEHRPATDPGCRSRGNSARSMIAPGPWSELEGGRW